ncbi:MAG: DHA2 family efflux MFS transporter permease subunit [Burkholderiaceae bacterium]
MAASQVAATVALPASGRRLIGTLALSLATFMCVLDISIANVSITAIAGALGASPSQGTWVITSFGVANAISLPLTGWLAQRFGTLRLFVASVLLFTTASFLCGISTSIEALVLCRVLQGAVAGPMIPLCQALLLRSHPPDRIGQALTILALTTLVAPVIGPLLGGWLTDNWSWHWIFLVNVPVGVVCGLVAGWAFRPLETAIRRVPVDGIGFGLLVLWVGALQLMLDLGRERDWFGSPDIIVLALIAGVGLVLFITWELIVPEPVVELRLFRSRNFLVGSVAMGLAYALFLGNLVLLPLWLQQHLGYTATLAGLALAPVGLLAIAIAPLVGRVVSRHDPRWLAGGAFMVFAFSLWLRSRFSTEVDFLTVATPSLVQGLGNAMFFVPLLAIILGGLPADRIASGSGLSNSLRYTLGAFGTSLMTTAWDRRAAVHREWLIGAIDEGRPGFTEFAGQLAQAGLSPVQQLALADRLIQQQAYTLAADDLFRFSAAAFVLLIGLLLFAEAPRRAAPEDAPRRTG